MLVWAIEIHIVHSAQIINRVLIMLLPVDLSNGLCKQLLLLLLLISFIRMIHRIHYILLLMVILIFGDLPLSYMISRKLIGGIQAILVFIKLIYLRSSAIVILIRRLRLHKWDGWLTNIVNWLKFWIILWRLSSMIWLNGILIISWLGIYLGWNFSHGSHSAEHRCMILLRWLTLRVGLTITAIFLFIIYLRTIFI